MDKRRRLFEAQNAVEVRKDALLGEIEARLKQNLETKELFTIRWRIEYIAGWINLKVLYSYHEQFLERGHELLALVDRIQCDGMSEEHAYQCVQLHCYYQRANALHHQDEERVLFPLIVHRSFLIDGMIERLTLDHEEIEEAWVELASLLGGPEQIVDRAELKRLAVEFEKRNASM